MVLLIALGMESNSFSMYIRNNDQVKNDEMGVACSRNGGQEECIQDIGGKARRRETTGKTKM
jgi:hypothetical protein